MNKKQIYKLLDQDLNDSTEYSYNKNRNGKITIDKEKIMPGNIWTKEQEADLDKRFSDLRHELKTDINNLKTEMDTKFNMVFSLLEKIVNALERNGIKYTSRR